MRCDGTGINRGRTCGRCGGDGTELDLERYDAEGVPRDMHELRVWVFKAWAKAVGLGLLGGTVLAVLILAIASILQAL